jgi:hypothetical protein
MRRHRFGGWWGNCPCGGSGSFCRRLLWIIAGLLSVVLVAGCANAKLQVAIDIYDENPRLIAPMSPEDTVKLLEDVEKLRQEARNRTSERVYLATVSRDVYVATLRQIVAEKAESNGNERSAQQVDNGGYKDINERLSKFKTQAETALQALEPQLDVAQNAASKYLLDYKKAYEDAKNSFVKCEKRRISGKYQHAPYPEATDKARNARASSPKRVLAGADSNDDESETSDSAARPRNTSSRFTSSLHEPDADDDCHPTEFTKRVERLDQEWILRRLPECLRTEEAAVRALVYNAASAYSSFASATATVQSAAGRSADTLRQMYSNPLSDDGECPPPRASTQRGGANTQAGLSERKIDSTPAIVGATTYLSEPDLKKPIAGSHSDNRTPAPQTQPAAAEHQGVEEPVAVFSLDWVGLRARLNRAYEAARINHMRSLERRVVSAILSLNSGMISIAQASKLISRKDIARAVEVSAQQSMTGLLDSSVRIGLELESLRSDLPESATAQTALASLARNSSQFFELIDRLQDPGSPVWRIVTDPYNEEHWNKGPSTEFFAEGNSSVVLVRNDPMRFDPHDATNNPTALIKGQLEISRAVADAAISVAGAAAGIGIPKPTTTGGTTSTGTDSSPSSDADAATEFAKRKATAAEAEKRRDGYIRSLKADLAAMLTSLRTSDADSVSDSQKTQLAAVLSAYKTMFEASTK